MSRELELAEATISVLASFRPSEAAIFGDRSIDALPGAPVTSPDQDLELKQEIAGRAGLSDEAHVIEARGKLVIPGFVNSHYHSYDVLAKGNLEDMTFDVWALHSQPTYFGRAAKPRSALAPCSARSNVCVTASRPFRI